MQEDCDFLYKIVLIGDSGVGKSNLIMRYMKNQFEQYSRTTIGVEFQSKKIRTEDDTVIKAQIWDTAGEEKYKSVTAAYFRGAVGALIVYDITQKTSFENINSWLEKLYSVVNKDVCVMLIGNKTDLID